MKIVTNEKALRLKYTLYSKHSKIDERLERQIKEFDELYNLLNEAITPHDIRYIIYLLS